MKFKLLTDKAIQINSDSIIILNKFAICFGGWYRNAGSDVATVQFPVNFIRTPIVNVTSNFVYESTVYISVGVDATKCNIYCTGVSFGDSNPQSGSWLAIGFIK